MAQLLSSSYSAEKCINAGRRYQRLSKQVIEDQTLPDKLTPPIALCKTKMKIFDEKTEAKEDAYDDVVLFDRFLDDGVRSLFEDCKQHDRNNPTELVLKQIFPDEKFGEIIRLHFATEVSEVEKIILRIENLGAEHSLAPHISTLKDKIGVVENALGVHTTTIRDEKMAQAEVEIAKQALIRQYEYNYLDVRQKYSKSMCEKVFPRIQARRSSNELDEPDESVE